MPPTDQHVEPIRPGGGLRRLRRGEVGPSQQSEQTVCSYAQFTSSLKNHIDRAAKDDASVLLIRLGFDALPGTAKNSARAQDLPEELQDRMTSVNEQIRVTVVSPTDALVLVPSLRRRADGEELANRLAVELTPPIEIEGLPHHLAPRIGAALFDQENRTVEDMLDGAQLALEGLESPATVSMFHPYQRVRDRRQQKKEQELRDAMLADQITCELQPAYDLETGRLIAFEAFARWHRDGRPSVSATEFIPMATEIGVMHQLSRQVMGKALVAASEWLDNVDSDDDSNHEPDGITLWFNVTPDEIRHPEFANAVAAATEVHPKIKIGLEVRPGVTAEDRDVQRILTDLVARGARAAMADFGVGPANLSMIEQLPYDAVKLGRELTRQMVQSPNGATIVESLVTMAAMLDFEIVAQGIETAEQASMVKRYGATSGQGYFFAEPAGDLEAVAGSVDVDQLDG